MAPRLAALLIFACVAVPLSPHRAAAQADFAVEAAREIDKVVHFQPPDFALAMERDAPIGFYGEAMNEFRDVSCERRASFGVIALANMAGFIRAGICVREVRRVRALAAYAQPALAGVIALLSEGGARIDHSMLDKFGWRYVKSAGADGAEEYYFPLVAVGHGVAHLPTLVRIPRGARRAILVQADTMKLCENYGLKDKTPLCSNTRQSLSDMARRLDARFRD